MSDVNLFPYIGAAIEMIALLLGLVLVLLFGTDAIWLHRRRLARQQRRLRAALLATSTRDAGERVA